MSDMGQYKKEMEEGIRLLEGFCNRTFDENSIEDAHDYEEIVYRQHGWRVLKDFKSIIEKTRWARVMKWSFEDKREDDPTPEEALEDEFWRRKEAIEEEFEARAEALNMNAQEVVHISSGSIFDWNIDEYLDGFMCIEGEVCASKAGDDFHIKKWTQVGLILKAKPRAVFDYDCWSYVDEDVDNSSRTLGKSKQIFSVNDRRHEIWFVPSESELIGLVASNNYAKKQLEKRLRQAGVDLDVFTISQMQKRDVDRNNRQFLKEWLKGGEMDWRLGKEINRIGHEEYLIRALVEWPELADPIKSKLEDMDVYYWDDEWT